MGGAGCSAVPALHGPHLRAPSLSPARLPYGIQPPHAIDPLLSSLPLVHPRCPGILPPASPPVPTNMRGEEGRCPLAAAASALHMASLGARAKRACVSLGCSSVCSAYGFTGGYILLQALQARTFFLPADVRSFLRSLGTCGTLGQYRYGHSHYHSYGHSHYHSYGHSHYHSYGHSHYHSYGHSHEYSYYSHCDEHSYNHSYLQRPQVYIHARVYMPAAQPAAAWSPASSSSPLSPPCASCWTPPCRSLVVPTHANPCAHNHVYTPMLTPLRAVGLRGDVGERSPHRAHMVLRTSWSPALRQEFQDVLLRRRRVGRLLLFRALTQLRRLRHQSREEALVAHSITGV
jgi:hypothetical protein